MIWRSCKDNGKAGPTAHGFARVKLLSHEELLQLPDVHPGLDHGLRVPLGVGPRLGPITTSWEGDVEEGLRRVGKGNESWVSEIPKKHSCSDQISNLL